MSIHLAAYVATVLLLVLLAIASRDSEHLGSPSLHTLTEVIAAVTALVVGAIAIMRYQSRRDLPYLFIGVGFLGAGLLDVFHAWSSSVYAYERFPSDLEAVTLWGWTVARIFLGTMLVLAGWAWWWGEDDGRPAVRDGQVYLFATIFIVATIALFFLVRLPAAQYSEATVPRPHEFVSGLLFLTALVGFFAMGRWRAEPAEHWLVLALITALGGQTLFAAFSRALWDPYYDLAHLLKIATNVLALIGLLLNLYVLQNTVVREERRLVDVNKRLEDEIVRRSTAERHAAEETELLRSVFDSIDDGIVVADSEGRMSRFNEAAAQILGRRATELPVEEWPTYYGVYRPDGRLVAPEELPLVRAVRGEVVEEEDLYLENEERPEGVSLSVSGRPLRGPDGETAGGVIVIRDVTTEHEVQDRLRRYTAELERRNQDLQDFATIVSHDLKEPLRKVLAFGERLESKLGPDLAPDAADHLRRMRQAADRMRSLIDDLLAYTRLNELQDLEEVDLNEVVTRAVQDLEERIHQTQGEVVVDPLCRLSCDPVQMYQVFANLISNGLKYHRPDVPPRVTVSSTGDESSCTIVVEDNGIGFDMKYSDRIFRPFHRLHTRSEYEGSGIGLAIVRKIVEQHGGSVAVDSTPGVGTRFSLTLPLYPTDMEVSANS